MSQPSNPSPCALFKLTVQTTHIYLARLGHRAVFLNLNYSTRTIATHFRDWPVYCYTPKNHVPLMHHRRPLSFGAVVLLYRFSVVSES